MQQMQANANVRRGKQTNKTKEYGKGGFKFDSDAILLNTTDSSLEELQKNELKNLVYPPSGTPRLVRIMIQMEHPGKNKTDKSIKESSKEQKGKVQTIKSKMYVIAISRKKLRNAFPKIAP